jgi:hypothetical protein
MERKKDKTGNTTPILAKEQIIKQREKHSPFGNPTTLTMQPFYLQIEKTSKKHQH